MASFNGLSLGLVFAMSTRPNPKARQINSYPGANGLQVIDHGSRGGRSEVSGAVSGTNPGQLAAREQDFRSLQQNGGAYVLVDTLGTSWGGVILENFAPQGRIYPLIGGGFARKYTAEFLHVF